VVLPVEVERRRNGWAEQFGLPPSSSGLYGSEPGQDMILEDLLRLERLTVPSDQAVCRTGAASPERIDDSARLPAT
jgi:hypothetical protein